MTKTKTEELKAKDEDLLLKLDELKPLITKKIKKDRNSRRSTKESKKKKNVNKFFDEEAGEGSESDDDCVIKVRECDTYDKEFLKPKAERLDDKMLDDMLKKYKDVKEEEMAAGELLD